MSRRELHIEDGAAYFDATSLVRDTLPRVDSKRAYDPKSNPVKAGFDPDKFCEARDSVYQQLIGGEEPQLPNLD